MHAVNLTWFLMARKPPTLTYAPNPPWGLRLLSILLGGGLATWSHIKERRGCFWWSVFEMLTLRQKKKVKSLFFFLPVGCAALEGTAGEPVELHDRIQNHSPNLPYLWKIAREIMEDYQRITFFVKSFFTCRPAPWLTLSCRLTPQHSRLSPADDSVRETWGE